MIRLFLLRGRWRRSSGAGGERNVIRITLRAKFALAGELNSRQSRELNYLAFGTIAKFAPAEQANEQIAVGNLNNSNRRS